jgi:CRP-like cAMP-binding protein
MAMRSSSPRSNSPRVKPGAGMSLPNASPKRAGSAGHPPFSPTARRNGTRGSLTPDAHYQVTSFREIPFESEEMKRLLSMEVPDYVEKKGPDAKYDSNALMPDWILSNPEWKSTRCDSGDNNLISEILQIAFSGRTQEQSTVLVKWLMSVWEIASTMGFKRCISMTEAMQYATYEPSKPIVTEGERGLVFYIIVSGLANVHKEGIGNVAQLTKGQSFGELALTQGKDLRTASVVASTRTEIICLHKRDYDHFVRDIQLGERRENFAAIKQCKLFEHWTRNKIERMCNTAMRKAFKEGEYIFKQGDQPDSLYLVVEGMLHAVRDVETVVTNRWPNGKSSWETISKKHVTSVFVKELVKGDYFGELSIIKNDVRKANVIAKSRCVLLTIDKLDFLHLLRHRNAIKSVMESAEEYATVNRTVDAGGLVEGQGSQTADGDSDSNRPGLHGTAGGERARKSSIRFKSAVFKAVTTGPDGEKKAKKDFMSTIKSMNEANSQARALLSPKRRESSAKTEKVRLVKHDADETVKLFREQLGHIDDNVTPRNQMQTVTAVGGSSPLAAQAVRAKTPGSSLVPGSRRGTVNKALSFNVQHHDEHDEHDRHSIDHSTHIYGHGSHGRDHDNAKPVLFSPITDLASINEEKSKNRVHIGLSADTKVSALNVSVTSTLEVSNTGRRQRSVCVKNVRDLVETTQQQWAQEVANSPIGVSAFRRQSSMGLSSPETSKDTNSLPGSGAGAGAGPVFSPKGLLTRRMSSFAEAHEDVERDLASGKLHLKHLKVLPPEFQKPVNDRAKLTFYEVMADKNEEAAVHLPDLSTSPSADSGPKPLLRSGSGTGLRRSNSRPMTSPNQRR